MKKVFRYEKNEDYWNRRWTEAHQDKDSFEDLSVYPIRFAEMVMSDSAAKVLEVGCGLGRVLKHYRTKGVNIVGMERSQVAVDKLCIELGAESAQIGDALDLPFGENTFDTIMAFGVYHNLEFGLEKGIDEVSRVLKSGGKFCISMRPDNLEMRLNELYWRFKSAPSLGDKKEFHKLLVREKEFSDLLLTRNLVASDIYRARNVSSLYRIPFLRASQKNEEEKRSSGYRLNCVGRYIDRFLVLVFPYHTANVLVFVGQRG